MEERQSGTKPAEAHLSARVIFEFYVLPDGSPSLGVDAASFDKAGAVTKLGNKSAFMLVAQALQLYMQTSIPDDQPPSLVKMARC
jgi:hypothetical protein